MIAYKLFRIKKYGHITSLFINKGRVLKIGEWLESEEFPTQGYKFRPYWHCTSRPTAPHLSMKGRKWFAVEIKDYIRLERPKSQGGLWLLAKKMKIIGEINDEKV